MSKRDGAKLRPESNKRAISNSQMTIYTTSLLKIPCFINFAYLLFLHIFLKYIYIYLSQVFLILIFEFHIIK